MSSNSGASHEILERLWPLALPLLRWAGPIVLRLILAWWLRRRRPQQLTRRQRVALWAAALGIGAIANQRRFAGLPGEPRRPFDQRYSPLS